MSAAPLLSFDEDAPRGAGEPGATVRIARALDACGIDAPTTLYDEALILAREGRLAPASERLRMLLCLDPNDAEAALLLGKILAAREQWQEALSWLDTSVSDGAVLPPGLREMVEDGLRRQVQDAEEYRTRVTARERGEVRNLRNEAKRLRSENAELEVDNDALKRRVRMWSSATAIVAGASSALLLAALLFGGGGESAAEQVTSLDGVALDGVATEEVAASEAAPVAASVTAPVAAAPVAANGSATVSVPVAGLPASAPGAAPTVAAEITPPSVPPALKTKTFTPSVSLPAAGALLATHTVRKGENLGAISAKYYKDSSKWPLIQAANADQLHGGLALSVGMKLKIPKPSK